MRTSLYSILCIVIRLGAVLFAFRMLEGGVGMVLSLQEFGPGEVRHALGFFVVAVLAAFVLWLYPGPLARMAAGRSARQVFEMPLAAQDVQWIAMSVLGLYFVISGLIGLGGHALNRFLVSELFDMASDSVRRKVIADGLHWLIRIGLGMALVLGARGLTGVLHRLRHGNTPVRAEPPSPSSG